MQSIVSFFKHHTALLTFFLFLTPVLLWSGWEPHGRELWLVESLPLWIGLIIIVMTYKNFPLSSFTYFSIFIGATLILIGEWFQHFFEWERNNYDKVGHFFQGFITAVITKEILIRKELMNSRAWIHFFALNTAVAISAGWEILEWFFVIILVSVGAKEPATDFLGTQGYIWDAQSDIFLATIGAVIAVSLFSRYHEQDIERLVYRTDINQTGTVKK